MKQQWSNIKTTRNISLILSVLILLSFIAAYLYMKNKESPAAHFYQEKMVYHGDAVTSNAPECAAIGMSVFLNHQ